MFVTGSTFGYMEGFCILAIFNLYIEQPKVLNFNTLSVCIYSFLFASVTCLDADQYRVHIRGRTRCSVQGTRSLCPTGNQSYQGII